MCSSKIAWRICRDRRVEVVDGLVQTRRTTGCYGERHGRLEGQSRGEELLDDVVVHVAGDPLALLEEREPPTVGVRLGSEDGHTGLHGVEGLKGSTSRAPTPGRGPSP